MSAFACSACGRRPAALKSSAPFANSPKNTIPTCGTDGPTAGYLRIVTTNQLNSRNSIVFDRAPDGGLPGTGRVTIVDFDFRASEYNNNGSPAIRSSARGEVRRNQELPSQSNLHRSRRSIPSWSPWRGSGSCHESGIRAPGRPLPPLASRQIAPRPQALDPSQKPAK